MTSELEDRQPAGDLRDDRRKTRRLRDWLIGAEEEEQPPHGEPVLDPVPGRIGICCSGGGIRSAAYNLGALQALQEEGVLEHAEYVAAVSGGSYIAASYATVAATAPAGKLDPPVYRALGAHTARRAIRHWMEDATRGDGAQGPHRLRAATPGPDVPGTRRPHQLTGREGRQAATRSQAAAHRDRRTRVRSAPPAALVAREN